ncbi:MAG: 6-phosphogluconolactonase, partial [Simkaniaceae bacterium]|nr:6-phosphogluconolactonase [Simkaniaceae bacterium]
RSAPPCEPESNFRMAIDAGFNRLGILKKHIFRMKAETDIEKHAIEYEEKITGILGVRPFDLIMLGMGEDGHTASLFPNTEALEETQRSVVANKVPQKSTVRMTMTYPIINQAMNIVIYVTGRKKAGMVRRVFLSEKTPPFPVSRVGTKKNKALWVLDSDACAPLIKSMKSR